MGAKIVTRSNIIATAIANPMDTIDDNITAVPPTITVSINTKDGTTLDRTNGHITKAFTATKSSTNASNEDCNRDAKHTEANRDAFRDKALVR